MAADVPKIVLAPHERSHQFNKRDCILNEPLKVGRSVDKKRISSSNLIFECRVLSRNHALIWFENGKFYIKDTKSSNGTFVNENRLSASGEESDPVELKSRDIVQFGVNVNVEKKYTHGCIIATIRLFINEVEVSGLDPPVQQVMQMVQTAISREQELENKLASMQSVINAARELASDSMIALVKEDELMSRLEMLENQLEVYSKKSSHDELKQQLAKVFEEKHKSELSSKDTVRNVLQEKLECVSKLNQLQRDYDKAEQECQRYKTLYDAAKEEHSQEVGKLSGQLKAAEKEKKTIQDKLTEEKQVLSSNIDTLKAEADSVKEQLTQMKSRLEETEEELVQLKIEREADRQRKVKYGEANGAAVADIVSESGEGKLGEVGVANKSGGEIASEDGEKPSADRTAAVVLGAEKVGAEGVVLEEERRSPCLEDQRMDTLIASETSLTTDSIIREKYRLEGRIKSLEDQLRMSTKRMKELEGQLNDAKSENELEGINVIGRRMSDTAIIKGQIELLEESLSEAQERITQLEGDLETEKARYSLLEDTTSSLRGDLTVVRERLTAKDEEIAKTKDELSVKLGTCTSLKTQVESSKSECDHLKSANSKLAEELAQMKDKYTAQLKDGVRIKTENTELIRTVENLKSQLHSPGGEQMSGDQQKVGSLPSHPSHTRPRPLAPYQQVPFGEDDEQRVKLLTFIALVAIGVALASWLT